MRSGVEKSSCYGLGFEDRLVSDGFKEKVESEGAELVSAQNSIKYKKMQPTGTMS